MTEPETLPQKDEFVFLWEIAEPEYIRRSTRDEVGTAVRFALGWKLFDGPALCAGMWIRGCRFMKNSRDTYEWCAPYAINWRDKKAWSNICAYSVTYEQVLSILIARFGKRLKDSPALQKRRNARHFIPVETELEPLEDWLDPGVVTTPGEDQKEMKGLIG